ncbi:MAG: hypothetical protein ACPW61_08940 [Methyloligella sp. ZOD6]
MARSIGWVSGLERLKSRFEIGSGGAHLRNRLRGQADAIAEEARRTLLEEHPGGTGALAHSVSVTETGEEDAPRFAIGTQSPVGRYLEFGTKRMAAQPWLIPTMHRHLQSVKRSARRLLERIVQGDS